MLKGHWNFLILFLVLCHGFKYSTYGANSDNFYNLRMTSKNNDEVHLDLCVIGSKSLNYNVPIGANSIKYLGNIVDLSSQDMCSIYPLPALGTEAVIFTAAATSRDHCDFTNFVGRNLSRVLNLQFLVLLVRDWRTVSVEDIRALNTDPLVFLLRQDDFNNYLKIRPLSYYKLGIYSPSFVYSALPTYVSCFIMCAIAAMAISLICATAQHYSSEILSLTSSVTKTHKLLIYLHGILFVMLLQTVTIYFRLQLDWLLACLCCIIGTHSLIFFAAIILRNVENCRFYAIPISYLRSKKIDLRMTVPLGVGIFFSTMWLINRWVIVSFLVSNIFSALITAEIAIFLAALYNINPKYKMILGMNGVIILIYVTVFIILMIFSHSVAIYIIQDLLSSTHRHYLPAWTYRLGNASSRPLTFNVPLVMLQPSCRAFFQPQAIIVNYIDIFIPGSYAVFMIGLLKRQGERTLIHILLIVNGVWVGVALKHVVLLQSGVQVSTLVLTGLCGILPSLAVRTLRLSCAEFSLTGGNLIVSRTAGGQCGDQSTEILLMEEYSTGQVQQLGSQGERGSDKEKSMSES